MKNENGPPLWKKKERFNTFFIPGKELSQFITLPQCPRLPFADKLCAGALLLQHAMEKHLDLGNV